MSERRIGIIVNGATGRMGRAHHLMASLMGIRADGGLALRDGTRLMPEPLLVGRNAEKLAQTAGAAGLDRWTTDLDAALAEPGFDVYFDGLSPELRAANVRQALEAGKHVYTEKPMALALDEAEDMMRLAAGAGVKTGVVCDKLWVPGFAKLLMLVRSGFFGDILMVRVDAGHWVFEGDRQPLQRPSWNYRKARGGGMIFDMVPHYAYLIEAIAGAPRDVVCHADTLVKKRWDEQGEPYEVDVEDTCLAISRLESGALAQITSSWGVRVRRDDVVVLQVDGTQGSAAAGLAHCWIQPRAATTRAEWSRDLVQSIDYYRDWQRVPDTMPYPNPFRAQWEAFLRSVVEDAPYAWDFAAGLRTVRYASACAQSWRERRWIDLA